MSIGDRFYNFILPPSFDVEKRKRQKQKLLVILIIWAALSIPTIAFGAIDEKNKNGILAFIYSGFDAVFGDSMTTEIKKFIENILKGMSGVLFDKDRPSGAVLSSNMQFGKQIRDVITLFSGLACGLILIYFFAHWIDMASKDMFTTDKLVLSCIQLFIAFALIQFLPEIIVGCLQIIEWMYETMSTASQLGNGSSKLQFLDIDDKTITWENGFETSTEFDEEFNKGTPLRNLLRNSGMVFMLIIPTIIVWIARLAAYFLVLSNALILIARVVMAPLAVAQCFDGGGRSSGIRYLKKLAATAMTFVIIILMMYVCQQLSEGVLLSQLRTHSVMGDGFYTALTEGTHHGYVHKNSARINGPALRYLVRGGKVMFVNCAIKLASVGGMFTGAKIAHDVVGE